MFHGYAVSDLLLFMVRPAVHVYLRPLCMVSGEHARSQGRVICFCTPRVVVRR